MPNHVNIEASWKEFLHTEWDRNYFKRLIGFIKEEKKSGKIIFPPGPKIFAAFHKTPVHQVKVVIIGQDPYHGLGQANGLAFSVDSKTAVPPSLRNIFKELHHDLRLPVKKNGDLSEWASQGVLMLNTTLTVEKGRPGSHQNRGWEKFTDCVIQKLSENKKNLVFLLWGRFAQGKESLIDPYKHGILKAAHPSPFSANMGFFGCKHFSKTNEFLKQHNLSTINW